MKEPSEEVVFFCSMAQLSGRYLSNREMHVDTTAPLQSLILV